MLENTIEGFVSVKELPQSFEFCDNFYFSSKKLNKSFKIGQKLKITCFNVNISLGKIDFKPQIYFLNHAVFHFFLKQFSN